MSAMVGNNSTASAPENAEWFGSTNSVSVPRPALPSLKEEVLIVERSNFRLGRVEALAGGDHALVSFEARNWYGRAKRLRKWYRLSKLRWPIKVEW